MSKRKFLFLYLGILTLISVIVIGSSSWFIEPRVTTDSGLNQSIDTSDYFAKELEFKKGTAQNSIGLTAEGIAIFGSGYEQNNNGTTGYTVSLTTDASMPGTYHYDNNVAITNSAHRGLVAGTHYYTITDNATGQVIAKNHQVVIKPAEFTVTVTNPTAPIFIGNSDAIATVKMVANDGANTTFSFTHTFGRDDYTPSSTKLYSYSGTKNLKNNSENTYSETSVPAFAAANATGINSNNYTLPTTYTVSAKILPTVYSYASNTATYYADLTQALSKTVSQTTTVIAMQSFTCTAEELSATAAATYTSGTSYKHTIVGNAEVGPGVKLILPFRPTTAFNASEEGIQTTDQYAKATSTTDGTVADTGHTGNEWGGDTGDNNVVANAICVNEVVLSGKLTVHGTLDVAGITGMPKPGAVAAFKQGMTSGKHAAITMTGGSAGENGGYENYTTIRLARKEGATNTPELNLRGYISADTEYAWVDSQIGKIEMPFVVYSFGGGGATVALFKGSSNGALNLLQITSYAKSDTFNVAPFHTFDMPNIQVELHCQYTSEMYGLASLFTNGAADLLKARYNLTKIKMFGNSDALFTMSDGKAIFDYNPDNTAAYKYTPGVKYVPNVAAATKITLDGSTDSGDMEMIVNVPLLGDISVSLANVKFPVSQKIKLYLTGNHSYTFTSQYKFLPGSELHILNGATVNIPESSGIMFYNSIGAYGLYNDTTYPAAKRSTPAICDINNATMNVLGGIGGFVKTTGSNAVLNLTNAKSLSMTETEGAGTYAVENKINLRFTYTEKQKVSLNCTADIIHSGSTVSAGSATSKTSYTSLAVSKNYAWRYQKNIVLSYNSNGGTAVANRTENNVWSNSGIVLSSTYLPTISREHYTFGGWYLDSAFKTAASGQKVYSNQTLYAKWNPISYTLNYESVYDGDPPTTSDWPSSGEFHRDMTTAINLTTPTDSNETYTFAGWYTDAACTNKINTESISIDTLFGLLGNGSSVTIYGKWLKESYTFTFDVAYDYISSQLDKPEVTYSLDELASAQWPSIATSYKEAQDKEYYFNGWIYDNGGTKVTLDSMTPAQFVETYGGTDDNKITKFTIEPDMVQKYKLTVNGASGAITFNNTLYLLDSQIAGAFADCDTRAKAKDSDPATNKYFTKWTKTNASGETITSIDSGMFTNMSLTIQANWGNKYKITYDGSTVVYVKPTASAALPTPEKTGNTFLGWYTESTGGTKIGDGGASYTPTADINLYSQWERIQYTITVTTDNATVSGVTNGQKAYYGDTITFTVTYTESNKQTITVKDADGNTVTTTGSYTFTMPASNVTISASSSGCVTPDTLITLADGSQVRVDSLRGDELLLVWNLETGKLDAAPIMFVDSEAMEEFNVVKLTFSDGTTVNVIYEHGFWDYDLNKYVYLDENAFEYIGHTFAKQNGDTLERVTLVDVAIEQVVTTAWSPVTVGHLCYFVNGMLSMPGGVGGLFNIFDVDPNTMTYDYEAMERDIATYGLYTYEELNEIAPLSRDMFEAAGGAYMKISIGKGNLTIEELISMIERYSRYFE